MSTYFPSRDSDNIEKARYNCLLTNRQARHHNKTHSTEENLAQANHRNKIKYEDLESRKDKQQDGNWNTSQ